MILPSKSFCLQPLNLCRHWPWAPAPDLPNTPLPQLWAGPVSGQAWGCWGSLEGQGGGRGSGQLASVPALGLGPSLRGGGLATQALAGAGFLAGLQGPPSRFLS